MASAKVALQCRSVVLLSLLFNMVRSYHDPTQIAPFAPMVNVVVDRGRIGPC